MCVRVCAHIGVCFSFGITQDPYSSFFAIQMKCDYILAGYPPLLSWTLEPFLLCHMGCPQEVSLLPPAFAPRVATFFFEVWDFRVIYRLGSGLSWGQQGCCSLSLTHLAAWNWWLFAYPLIIVLSPHFLLAENTWLFWRCAGFASCLYPLLTCENDHRKGKQVTEGAAVLLPTHPIPSRAPENSSSSSRVALGEAWHWFSPPWPCSLPHFLTAGCFRGAAYPSIGRGPCSVAKDADYFFHDLRTLWKCGSLSLWQCVCMGVVYKCTEGENQNMAKWSILRAKVIMTSLYNKSHKTQCSHILIDPLILILSFLLGIAYI